MQKWNVIMVTVLGLILSGQTPALSGEPNSCAKSDEACKEFAKLSETEQYDRIIKKVDAKRTYSEAARKYIGEAYLMIAGRETNTPEQEEQFCLKALEYGATSAYMGLYFIHAATDEEKALGYLKQYVTTKPQDSVPYVLLGEAELEKRNYTDASIYLSEAKSVARGHSSNLDWLLFQATYLKGDYIKAATLLDESFSRGKTVGDLKALITSDSRFSEIGKRPEFKRFSTMINGITSPRFSRR
jgi:tetratricopeptide (TPR) repeat protein